MSSQSRENLRKEIFESMKRCSQTYMRSVSENILHTQKLMIALSEFYRIPPSDNLITRENFSQYELQIATEFVNMGILSFSLESFCLTQQEDHLRNMAEGFAALRIEIVPQFDNIDLQSLCYYFIHKLCEFEEVIREEIFRRSHLIECNDNEDRSNVERKCCNCNRKRVYSWKREFNGELKCNWCFFINDRSKIDRRLPYRMLSINGVPKKYYNLISRLNEEYSLTD